MTEHRRRKNVRLQGYDYSTCGAYFVTICTHEREMLFGRIENGIMHHNEMGRIAVEEIENVNVHRRKDGIYISEYIVMPNHVHFIVNIVGKQQDINSPVGTRLAADLFTNGSIAFGNAVSEKREGFSKPVANSLSSVVRSYKSAVSKRVHETCDGHGKPCPYTVWQARYYEHIIRNEDDYRMIAEYILTNPNRWNEDRFNEP